MPLHLRFAITPIGPSLQPLADAVSRAELDSDRHELNLAALLVCLMVEEAEFGARPEARALVDPPLTPTRQAEAAWLAQNLTHRWPPDVLAAIPSADPGLALDDDGMKLLHGRSVPDTDWLPA